MMRFVICCFVFLCVIGTTLYVASIRRLINRQDPVIDELREVFNRDKFKFFCLILKGIVHAILKTPAYIAYFLSKH